MVWSLPWVMVLRNLHLGYVLVWSKNIHDIRDGNSSANQQPVLTTIYYVHGVPLNVLCLMQPITKWCERFQARGSLHWKRCSRLPNLSLVVPNVSNRVFLSINFEFQWNSREQV